MNNLKDAIKIIWLGTAASLIGFICYLIGGVSEKALPNTATVMILIFAASVVHIIGKAKRQIAVEALMDPRESQELLKIVDWMGTAYMAAFFLGIMETWIMKKGDLFFVLSVPLASMILGAAGMLSFDFYMKRRMKLQWVMLFNARDVSRPQVIKALERINKEDLKEN
jgi:hypothetical protein